MITLVFIAAALALVGLGPVAWEILRPRRRDDPRPGAGEWP